MTEKESNKIWKELLEIQKSLLTTEERREQSMQVLRNNYKEIMANRKKDGAILQELKTELKKTKDEVEKTNTELRKLSQTVAKIEYEHGGKIQSLLDTVTSYPEKFDSIENRLESIETKIDKHSDQIYCLNSKVQAF